MMLLLLLVVMFLALAGPSHLACIIDDHHEIVIDGIDIVHIVFALVLVITVILWANAFASPELRDVFNRVVDRLGTIGVYRFFVRARVPERAQVVEIPLVCA
jgi:hypothetical protein